MKHALIFLAIGLATLALRASFLVSGSASSAEPQSGGLRRFIPVAALTALIIPAISAPAGEAVWVRPLATGLAAVIAWRTSNVLLTVVLGLLAFWGLRGL